MLWLLCRAARLACLIVARCSVPCVIQLPFALRPHVADSRRVSHVRVRMHDACTPGAFSSARFTEQHRYAEFCSCACCDDCCRRGCHPVTHTRCSFRRACAMYAWPLPEACQLSLTAAERGAIRKPPPLPSIQLGPESLPFIGRRLSMLYWRLGLCESDTFEGHALGGDLNRHINGLCDEMQ